MFSEWRGAAPVQIETRRGRGIIFQDLRDIPLSSLPPSPRGLYLVKQVGRHSGRSKLIFLSGAAPPRVLRRNDIQLAAETELGDHFTHSAEISVCRNKTHLCL